MIKSNTSIQELNLGLIEFKKEGMLKYTSCIIYDQTLSIIPSHIVEKLDQS
jgi:hypothetical protein